MKHYRLTLWLETGEHTGALQVDIDASTPGRAIDNALDKYRLPVSAVIGWEQVTKRIPAERVGK